LRRVGRVDVDHSNADASSLVLYELLQLSPRPTVQSCTHALGGSDLRADVDKMLRATAAPNSLADNGCAYLVIDVTRIARLSARDFRQQLSCRLRAVALKSRAQCQKTIARIPEFAPSVQTAAAGRRSDVFAQIDAKHSYPTMLFDLRKIEYNVQVPPAALLDELRFAQCPPFEIVPLERTYPPADDLAPVQCKKRDAIFATSIRSRIKMHGRFVAERRWLPRSTVRTMGFHAASHGSDRIAGHLCTQLRPALAYAVIGQVMQPYAVRAPMPASDFGQRVTRKRESHHKPLQSLGLPCRGKQSKCNRPLHITQSTPSRRHQYGIVRKGRFILGINAEVSAPTMI
jgi:hypothetical protein